MAVPARMQAAVIDRFGGPEMLRLDTVPVPALSRGEVLIAVHTAGVGSWDADIRGGWWPEGQPQFPLILGTDGSGEIAAIGPGVRRFADGDKVYSYSFLNPKGGFYAEYVAVAASRVGRVPDGLGMREAGAVPTIGLTALQGIAGKLRLRGSESGVVIGASGGVGAMAVQFARARGARVIAVVASDAGLRLAKELGADHSFNGRETDVADAIREIVPNGADALFTTAGGDVLQRAMTALKKGGRVAWPNGVEPEPDLSARRDVKAFSYDAEPNSRNFERLGKAIVEARLKVPIAAEFPLADTAGAHERLNQRPVLGKIVLRIR